MYKLKKGVETFTIMSGEFEGRTFRRGVEYEKIPYGFKNRFEKTEPVKKEKGVKNAVNTSKS